MPLFMDRHDLPGMTAEQVAQAHLTDIQIESKYGVQFLAYWFDAEHGQVFCLARAPGPEDMQAVHRAGHGLVPNEIIAVSEDDVFRFLGRVNDPVDHTQVTRAFRTILFTDLEGSTSLLQDVGEAAYMGLLAEHDLIIRRSLVAWQGREVKHTGDGIMASFEDVASALDARWRSRPASRPGRPTGRRPSFGYGSGSPPVSPSTTTTTCSGPRSTSPAGSAAAAAGHILTSDVVRDLGDPAGRSRSTTAARSSSRDFPVRPRSSSSCSKG